MIQIHREYDIAISKFKASGPSFSESSHLWNDIGVCFTGKHKFLAVSKYKITIIPNPYIIYYFTSSKFSIHKRLLKEN